MGTGTKLGKTEVPPSDTVCMRVCECLYVCCLYSVELLIFCIGFKFYMHNNNNFYTHSIRNVISRGIQQ